MLHATVYCSYFLGPWQWLGYQCDAITSNVFLASTDIYGTKMLSRVDIPNKMIFLYASSLKDLS
jgi:hypothetical protein